MRKVDGLIIMGEHIKQEYLLYYRQQMIPYVLVGKRNFDPLPHLSVTSDFHSGAYKATNYIIKKGRRRVVYIQGLVDTYHENERFAGYCKALLESKIEKILPFSLLVIGISMTEAYFDDVSIELNVPVTPPEEISDVLLNPGFEGLRVFSNKVAVTPGES